MLAYINARDRILDYIKENNFKTGDRLPAESAFSELLGIGRLSLREGLTALKNDGIILSVQGKGTFVGTMTDNISDTLNINYSVSEMITNSGHKPGSDSFEKHLTRADEVIAKDLCIEEGSEILMCKRVRTSDGSPVIITEDYVAPHLSAIFMGFNENELSLYNFIENNSQVRIGSSLTELSPMLSNDYIESVFKMDQRAPIMKLKNVVMDKLGTPILVGIEYFKAESFKFLITRGRS